MAFLEFKPTQILYKYCSSDGFLGMIKSKRLWFSDLASANDPREIKLGYERLQEAIELIRKENYKGEQGAFLSVLSEHLTRVYKSQRAFCSCLSLVADDLPMWNAYGENYSGLVIGFRPTSLFDTPGRLQKVKYLKYETIEEYRDFVLDLASKFDRLGHAATDLTYWVPAAAAVFAALTALKHTTWSYEQEVRLVYTQKKQAPESSDDLISSIIGQWPDGKLIKWTEPLKRVDKNGNAVGYLEFPFGKFRRGAYSTERAIKSIILGPKCPHSIGDVSTAMKEAGFGDFEVVASVCQIR